jgi:DNA-directed RNA polymerase subunit L
MILDMEVEILESGKNELEIKVDNLTVAEIIRVYLNEQGIEFAAWNREHPSKPAVLRVKSGKGTVKKAISDAVAGIKKDCDAILKAVGK